MPFHVTPPYAPVINGYFQILPSPDGLIVVHPSIIAASALEWATDTDRLVCDALSGGSLKSKPLVYLHPENAG